MSKLQQLLDEKFPRPITGDPDSPVWDWRREAIKYFTEGYNAAMQEVKAAAGEGMQAHQNHQWDGTLGECKAIRDGQGMLYAVKYLRQNGHSGSLEFLKELAKSL